MLTVPLPVICHGRARGTQRPLVSHVKAEHVSRPVLFVTPPGNPFQCFFPSSSRAFPPFSDHPSSLTNFRLNILSQRNAVEQRVLCKCLDVLDQYSTSKYLDPFHDVAALTRSCLAHQWSVCTKYELSRSPLVQQHYQALANSRSPDMPTHVAHRLTSHRARIAKSNCFLAHGSGPLVASGCEL